MREVQAADKAEGAEAGVELGEAVVDELVELLDGVDLALAVDAAEDAESVRPGVGLEEEDEVLVGVPVLRQAHIALEDQVPVTVTAYRLDWAGVAGSGSYQGSSLILASLCSSRIRSRSNSWKCAEPIMQNDL